MLISNKLEVNNAIWLSLTKWKNRTLRIGIRVYYFYQFSVFYRKLCASKFSVVLNEVTPSVRKKIKRKFSFPYLTSFLLLEHRINIYSRHYDFIDKNLNDNFFIHLNKGIVVWELESECDAHQILLKVPEKTSSEGDLLLEYHFNKNLIYQLTFSFVDGKLMEMNDEQMILIGGSQGLRGSSELIRAASKKNNEICPATALVIALKAITQALDIKTILGLKAQYHVSIKGSSATKGHYGYDDLWVKNYGEESPFFYVMPTSASKDGSESVSGNHHSRTRRRRRKKEEMMNIILNGFIKYISDDK
ncbi:DUF535 family protein [Methylobacter sp. S3L5C]|uniref:DUF535 family protein n=1 Tax=Methylobacter sp. S3L5C TaxID=2839024 RepID=UPI001FAC3C8D|nr:DUF535 family protein [Methylobacter sp. S3L5C]UOA07272.1 DUF535 family protein [Methylobacter sp. S3L5C]